MDQRSALNSKTNEYNNIKMEGNVQPQGGAQSPKATNQPVQPTNQAKANPNPPSETPTQQQKKNLISNGTKEKAQAAKAYIEKKYSKLKQEEKEKKENWEILMQKMNEMNLSSTEKELIKHDILHKEAELLRKRRQKISAKDFEPLTIIGRGAFGEVRICRDKAIGEIVAIKKMKKSEMLVKGQVGHVRAEKDVLANSNIPWIVDLKYSFQDEKYLYLVMEYLCGGDLMTLLMKKDILTEEESKFYIAEIILAVDSVHKMNYIHRDLKPDNILIDSLGHIKLSDFGLCKQAEIRPMINFGKKKDDENRNDPAYIQQEQQNQKMYFKRNRKLAFSTVGTPDYIAPEVFGQGGYNETVDWWSIGVILFEMLVGYPPFFSEEPSLTCQKILHWKKTFVIPPEANLSPAAADLIRRLIADPQERLGVNGVQEIKIHPFFFGVDWNRIRDKKAPYIPEVKSEIDSSNFDKFEEEEPWIQDDGKPKKKNKNTRKQDINFIGYTFKRDLQNQRSQLVAALENLEQSITTQARQRSGSPQIQKHSTSGGLTHNNSTGNLETYKMNNTDRAGDQLGSTSVMNTGTGQQKLYTNKTQGVNTISNRPTSPKGSNGSNSGGTASNQVNAVGNLQNPNSSKLIANIQYNQKISQPQQPSPKGVTATQKPLDNVGYAPGFMGSSAIITTNKEAISNIGSSNNKMYENFANTQQLKKGATGVGQGTGITTNNSGGSGGATNNVNNPKIQQILKTNQPTNMILTKDKGNLMANNYSEVLEKKGQTFNYDQNMFKKKDGSPNGHPEAIGLNYQSGTGGGSQKNMNPILSQKLPTSAAQIGTRVPVSNNTKGVNNASPLKGSTKD